MGSAARCHVHRLVVSTVLLSLPCRAPAAAFDDDIDPCGLAPPPSRDLPHTLPTRPRSGPDTSRPLPYTYVKVTRDDALRLRRIPTSSEQALLATGARPRGLVDRQMKGVFFLAVEGLSGAYLRTIRGRYVARADVELPPSTLLSGEALGRTRLPLAFVFGEDRPLFRIVGGELRQCGIARRYARFHVDQVIAHEDGPLVAGPDHVLLRRDDVRVATRRAPPAGIDGDEKWMHVDLPEQILVAYEGQRPIFATLVSTGRDGHTTPTGLYHIRSKHVTTTMRGKDDGEGWYEVEEVPWTMYYSRCYAIHGAYWHDGFGDVRSHGCTNLAPVDARWLFSRCRRATPVMFTD